MALTIDATLMGESANSYCDLAYADDYFSAHPNSVKRDGWAALSDESKTMALIQACTMLEALKMTQQYESLPPLGTRMAYGNNWPKANIYQRYPANVDQALQLPRNVDYKASTGQYFMPEPAKMAQCEQAYYLAVLDESELEDQRKGKKGDQFTAQGVQVSTSYTGDGDAYSPLAITLIKPFLIKTTKLGRR